MKHGIFILDPASLDEIAHIAQARSVEVIGYSADGTLAYLRVWSEITGAGTIHVLDLAGLGIIAERGGTMVDVVPAAALIIDRRP